MTGYTFSQLFDFTRTTAGTFVGSNGLIQNTPASVNLLTFTQEFDNAIWVKQAGTSISANAASAPDGTLTADAFVKGSGTTGAADLYRDAGVSALGVPSLLSIFVKANGIPAVRITGGGSYSPNGQSRFDLVSGTVVAGGGSITAFGNGWYRCVISLTRTSTADNSVYIAPCNVDGTFPVGNGVSGILLWGAQLEAGSTATTYTRNNGGVFPARFDYDPVTLLPRGLLVEEQRVNLFTYSEQFDNVAWFKDGTTVTANAATAPDGAATADLVIPSTAAASPHIVFRNAVNTFAVNAPATVSFYAKAAGYNFAAASIIFNSNSSGAGVVFDLVNLTAATLSASADATIAASVVDAGNGWRRCVLTVTSSSVTLNSVAISMSPTASPAVSFGYRSPSFTGDGTSGMYFYGAQLEVGAFATSYIPTVASQVTRSADICNITAPMFAPWYNQSAGTFLVEYTQGSGTTARAATVASDGTNSNTVELYIDGSNDATTLPFYGVYVAGAAQAALSFAAATQNATHKMGAAYQANDFAGSVDGASVVTDTSGTLPTVNRLSIGSSGTAATAFANGHIRRVTYYPFRASNNQLQALTT